MDRGDASNEFANIVTDRRKWSMSDRAIANPVCASVLSTLVTAGVLANALLKDGHQQSIKKACDALNLN